MPISVGIIALNEEEYLPSLLNDISSQTFPLSEIELLLIDSMSSDDTKSIMEEFKHKESGKFSDIRIFENEGKWQSNGWNLFIDNAKGDVLVRIDAHSKIPKNFLTSLVNNLKVYDCGVIGGRRPTILKDSSNWAKILLEAENSLFGSGIAAFRNSDKPRLVKSVFHGAYRKEVFERVGKFNEDLHRTEDNEIHYRIRKLGYKIMYIPSIESYQYARPTLRKMLKQKFLNGFWIGKTTWICPKCLSLYHYIPFLFISSLMIGFLLVIHCSFLLFLILIVYGVFDIINTTSSIINKKNFKMIILFILFPMLHIAYGIGTFVGIFRKNTH